MTKKRNRQDTPDDVVAAAEVSASQGSNAAGRDIVNSVAIHADHATLLPAQAYEPIPDEAPKKRLQKIPSAKPFFGRHRELDALDAAFTTSDGVVLRAVSGLGGVGKSKLAARWATCHATARVRWWITADSESAVDAGLAELAQALQPGLSGLPVELQKERAVAWLASHDDWLIVLDNVDHPDHIRPLLDRLTGGQVLITTRRATNWHQIAKTLHLGVLSPEESAELFTEIDPREFDGIQEVCIELGHLPLAIEQAAAYCHETTTTPLAYLDMLHRSPAETYASSPEGFDAERTMERIWRITLDRLADTPLSGRVLRILAWYAPDHIPRTLLDGLAPPPTLTAAVGRLLAYSMLTANPDGTLSVHRLVQALARTPQADDPHRQDTDIQQAREQATTFLKNAFPSYVLLPAHWPRCRALLPHVDALIRNTPHEHDTLSTAYLLDRAAAFRQDQGTAAPALTYLIRALCTTQRILGPGRFETLSARNNLAHTYGVMGDTARTVVLHEENLTAFERVLGPDHPGTLICRNNLAAGYLSAGDSVNAIRLSEQNLIDFERVFGPEHPKTLSCRNILAYAYQSAENFLRAIPLFEKNLEDRIRVVGPNHPDTLVTRNNLAYSYESLRDWARVIPLYEQNLVDGIRVLGPDHSDTPVLLDNLARAYGQAAEQARGIPLYELILAECERWLGEKHRLSAAVRAHLNTARANGGSAGQTGHASA
ncbi:tetratricopeptide repeat protein [Streptomyces sp. NPDC056244]|uniref:tetratricopeptide repeat protein n=1 Tax=Streptomyces sp. NPDC056244 TaxID=3345762 RepID=UPI0035DB5762